MPPFNSPDPTADTAAPAALLPRMTPPQFQAWLETLLAIADNESELLDKSCDFRAYLYFRGVRHRVDMAVGAGLVSLPELARSAAIEEDARQMI